MRGADIVKAMALGAHAVGLGRLQGLALGAGGEAGVVRMLELLEDEVTRTPGHARRHVLRRAEPELRRRPSNRSAAPGSTAPSRC